MEYKNKLNVIYIAVHLVILNTSDFLDLRLFITSVTMRVLIIWVFLRRIYVEFMVFYMVPGV